MGKIDKITPIFYVRGYNQPYNEGYIEVVRNMIKALNLQNMKSVVFNYRYDVGFRNIGWLGEDCEDAPEVRFEQKIPLIDREVIFHQNSKLNAIFSSLMETLAMSRFLSIERYLRRRRFCILNVINCFRYPRIFANEFLGLPMVLHYYTRKQMVKNALKLLFNRVDMVVTSSVSLAGYLEENYGIDKLKIQTVYPPIDTAIYKPIGKNKSRRRLGLNKSTKILCLGNLGKNRFPEDIILRLMKKIVKRNPMVELLVFSPKSEENLKRRTEILAKASAFNLRRNIKIDVRNLSEVEKSTVYSASDVFLFPALKSREAIEPPVTVLEAMSCGLPVVSNGVASISEIITHKVNGLIMPFIGENISSLEEQIFSLIEDNKVKTEVSKRARQTVIEKMSLDKSCKKLVEIFTKLEN